MVLSHIDIQLFPLYVRRWGDNNSGGSRRVISFELIEILDKVFSLLMVD